MMRNSPSCWSAAVSFAHLSWCRWQPQIPAVGNAGSPGWWCLHWLPVSCKHKKRFLGDFCFQKTNNTTIKKSYLRSSITLACSFSSRMSTTLLVNFLPRGSITWFPITTDLRGSTVSCGSNGAHYKLVSAKTRRFLQRIKKNQRKSPCEGFILSQNNQLNVHSLNLVTFYDGSNPQGSSHETWHSTATTSFLWAKKE